MTEKTKQLFDSLNLLRYSAEHRLSDITMDEIQDAYYNIFDLISQLKQIEDQQQLAIQAQNEQQKKFDSIHKKVMKNFDNKGAIEIAKDISDRIVRLGINKTYIISEMDNGKIGIISGTNANDKQVIRTYDDIYDFTINIEDDLKCEFKREKLFSNIKTLKKGDHE